MTDYMKRHDIEEMHEHHRSDCSTPPGTRRRSLAGEESSGRERSPPPQGDAQDLPVIAALQPHRSIRSRFRD
eukprot:5902198-Lingulodinium_polyedra.AAC.1